jgi:uncharacterized membrane protein
VNLSAALLPPAWMFVVHALAAVLALWVLRTAPWRRLTEPAISSAFPAAVVILTALWSIRPPPLGGIEIHFLGATVLTLMFGPPLALFALSLVLLGTTALGGLEPAAWSLHLLVLGVLPVGASQLVLQAAERWLPRNIFVYLFIPAFLGAALTLAVTGTVSLGLIGTLADAARADMAWQSLPFCLLLAFGEATLSGMVLTLMVVYRPDWVGTFDDSRYLRKQ